MDRRGFDASLAGTEPPAGLPRPLAALWHLRKGDWNAAHGLVQQEEGEPRHDWVHAHLHRVEGDACNAAYWYRRAKKPVASGPIDAEWGIIVDALLADG